MRWKIQEFMRGRNGIDPLNQALLVVYLVCAVVSLFVRTPVLRLLEDVLFLFCIYRIFSRRLDARSRENEKYMSMVHLQQMRWKYRKEYKVFRCVNCGKIIRVPRHKGKVEVSCPQCRQRKICRT